MKFIMRKFSLIAVLVVAILTLVGCGSKPKSVVDEYFSSIKSLDYEKMQSCLVDSYNFEVPLQEQTAEYQVMSDYIEECATKISYSIKDEKVNGDTAEVTVDVNYVDASQIMSATLGDYLIQAFSMAFSGASDEEIESLLGDIFSEKIQSIETGTANAIIKVSCVKTDDGWKISAVPEELFDVLTANMLKVFESMGDDEVTTDADNTQENVESVVSVQEDGLIDIALGTTVELATVKITLKDVSEMTELTSKYLDPLFAADGTKYVVIGATIENTTKSPLNFNNVLPLEDSQGRTFNSSIDVIGYFDNTFNYVELAPNIPQTGVLVYNVPADSSDYHLLVSKQGTDESYCLLTK